MRFIHAAGAALLLCACTPEIPDSAAGFGPMATQRPAPSDISPVIPSPQVVSLPPQQHRPVETPAVAAAPLSATAQPLAAPVAAPVPMTAAQVARQAGAAQPARQAAQQPEPQPSGGISEQDFPTLLARGGQGGDGAPRAQGPVTVDPVARQPVPERPADMPNVVHYALSTTHGVGERRWRRSAVSLQSHQRNCAGFVSADLAQEEFLRRGGPERDPMNLDPDGDGFACWWSPEPFRAMVRAAN